MVADVTVVGIGIIGLSTAIELADRGLDVRLVGTAHQGDASSASAGMLAASIEPELGAVEEFAVASRERYPAYLTVLEERTKIPVPLNRRGILQVALTPEQCATLPSTGEQLDPDAIAVLEPSLGHAVQGVLHSYDGCVDPLLLLDALRLLVARHPRITAAMEDVCTLHVADNHCTAVTDKTSRYSSRWVVMAAGAWTSKIEGLPSPIPVEPARGQMVAFDTTEQRPLRHVVIGPAGYVVPKADGYTIAGSTMERVGYATDTTEDGIATATAIGRTICPALAETPVKAAWAGLRPVTPDLLPVIGPDPEAPHVLYACGHSRNGILLAPLTAEVIADLVVGAVPRYDLRRFRAGRFAG